MTRNPSRENQNFFNREIKRIKKEINQGAHRAFTLRALGLRLINNLTPTPFHLTPASAFSK